MNRRGPILVVEDDALDVKNLRRALGAIGVANPVHYVANGEEALAFLRNQYPFDDPGRYPAPGLVLVDLNMPRMGGLDFLAACRGDPQCQDVRAVVMTTSDQPSDRVRSLALGALAYVVKPIGFDDFVSTIRNLSPYWAPQGRIP